MPRGSEPSSLTRGLCLPTNGRTVSISTVPSGPTGLNGSPRKRRNKGIRRRRRGCAGNRAGELPVGQHLGPHSRGGRLHVTSENHRIDWLAALGRIDCDLDVSCRSGERRHPLLQHSGACHRSRQKLTSIHGHFTSPCVWLDSNDQTNPIWTRTFATKKLAHRIRGTDLSPLRKRSNLECLRSGNKYFSVRRKGIVSPGTRADLDRRTDEITEFLNVSSSNLCRLRRRLS